MTPLSAPDSLKDDALSRVFTDLGFVTSSPVMTPLLRQALKAAHVSDITLLIEGETGTGKQVLAQAIHRLDRKRGAFPFVTIHCGTINDSLAESELFGHERGAFSGAIFERKGLFQAAHRGVVFLDDVNDLPPGLQPKLLDVLQRGVIRKVGSDKEIRVDVRIISACNRPLGSLAEDGRFRLDLYHRLNVVKLPLSPLRERRGDLQALLLAFAARHNHIYPEISSIEPALLRYLEQQPFPGNVRELEHALERALFSKSEGSLLCLADWLGEPTYSANEERWAHPAADILWRAIFERGLGYGRVLQEVEKELLQLALERGRFTRQELAGHLKTSERTLYHKLKSHKSASPVTSTSA